MAAVLFTEQRFFDDIRQCLVGSLTVSRHSHRPTLLGLGAVCCRPPGHHGLYLFFLGHHERFHTSFTEFFERFAVPRNVRESLVAHGVTGKNPRSTGKFKNRRDGSSSKRTSHEDDEPCGEFEGQHNSIEHWIRTQCEGAERILSSSSRQTRCSTAWFTFPSCSKASVRGI